jgi:hypothetical protein
LAAARSLPLPNAFSAALVYRGDKYVGYVDPYGEIHLKTDARDSMIGLGRPILLGLELWAVLSLLVFIIWCFRQGRNGSGFAVVVKEPNKGKF